MNTQQDIVLFQNLRKELDLIKQQIASMRIHGDQSVSLPGQFTKRAIPARIGAEIDFDGTLRKQQINIIVPPDGPFHASRIAFAFRYYDRVTQDQALWISGATWRPVSSIEDLDLSFFNFDFYWEYKTTGSERDRQNIPVPSAMLTRTETGNGWMPLVPQDVFQASSTVIVYITPTVVRTVNHGQRTISTGKIWAGFCGFYSLDS